MINKWKKYSILTAQLPLTIVGILVKSVVAIAAFTYFRWVRRGIYLGERLHTRLESHEMGYRINNKTRGL